MYARSVLPFLHIILFFLRVVSISLIFPLLNHPSRIFFLDIPNDAKKSLKPLGHMRPVGGVYLRSK